MFTDRSIKAMKSTGKPYRKFEHGPDKGFGIQVTAAGVKTFFMQYKSPENGKRRFMRLGSYQDIPLQDARNECRKARALVDKGIDPQTERDKQEKQNKDAHEKSELSGSVQQLFDDYIKHLITSGKASHKDVQQTYDKNIAPYIGKRKVHDVTADEIYEVIQRVYNRGAKIVASHVRTNLMAAFNFGMQAKFNPTVKVSASYSITSNPVMQIPRLSKVTPGERNLSKEEIRQLWFALEHTGMQRASQIAIKLLITTGQRVEEVLGMQWSEIKSDDKLWELSASRTKNNISHVVPLTDFSLSLIESLRGNSESEYLFPHRDNSDSHIPHNSLSQSVRRYCAKDGTVIQFLPIARFVPKDLRRTVKSRMGEIGIDKQIRDRMQNHALHDVSTKHYDRYDYLPEKRKAMLRWNEWLEAILLTNEN